MTLKMFAPTEFSQVITWLQVQHCILVIVDMNLPAKVNGQNAEIPWTFEARLELIRTFLRLLGTRSDRWAPLGPKSGTEVFLSEKNQTCSIITEITWCYIATIWVSNSKVPGPKHVSRSHNKPFQPKVRSSAPDFMHSIYAWQIFIRDLVSVKNLERAEGSIKYAHLGTWKII